MEVHTLHFPSIDSTNGWAKAHFDQLDPFAVTCITADLQTKGKGRYRREWISKKGNLALTLAFTVSADSPLLPHLAQLLSLSIWEVLNQNGVTAEIKWPNDLLVDEKKLGGILVETFPFQDGHGVVAGVGLNVNAPVSPDQIAISLIEISSKKWDLTFLRDKITHQFLAHLTRFSEEGFAPAKQKLESCLAYKGEMISCEVGARKIIGVLEGLSDLGELLVRTKEQGVCTLFSAEITHLRKKR